MTDGLRARVSASDDGAHVLLVKALETAAALQRFQVTANRFFAHKLLELRFSNQPTAQQSLGAFPAHRPTLAFGKRLLEKLEVRERRHSVNAQFLQLFAHKDKIKPRFEMVHTGFQKALPVQSNPKPDRPQPGRGRDRKSVV